MSAGLAKDFYTSVIELISNSHDAGAHNLAINASLDRLVLEDDGKGMDRVSIQDFFTKGTDYKRVHTETDEGRQVLGRFGLATLLLRHLGDAYRLETWRRGEKIVVNQDFVRDGWKSPRSQVMRSDEATPSGTRITITKPAYKLGSDQFNLDKLKSEITWGFPPIPDFRIILNSVEVPKRATVRYGIEYDVSAQITDKVRISGSIFYNGHSGKRSGRLPFNGGIILYSNGRRVGDPEDFREGDVGRRLAGKIIGFIDIHGLSDRIRFDRSGFLRTEAYLQIKDHIERVLQGIRTDQHYGMNNRQYYEARKKVKYIEMALDSATERLNAKLRKPEEERYALAFDTGELSGPIARYDQDSRVIYINQANPQLVRKLGEKSSKDLEGMILMAAIVALGEHEVARGSVRTMRAFSALDREIVEASARLFSKYPSVQADLRTVNRTDDVAKVSEIYLNPSRLYETHELAQMTGWDVSTIKVLALSSLQDSEMHGNLVSTRKIRGDRARELLARMEGFVPARKIIDPEYWHSDWRYGYDFSVDRMLQERIDGKGYLVDIGVLQPFMVVERGHEREFLRSMQDLVEVTHG
jgi:hypothetical protein